MPSVLVNDQGAELYYDDSGAPSNASVYTTLVIIHGAIFNGGIFQRVASNAASNNLRVLSVYHRDVLPSTAFTPEELRVFKSSNPHVHEAWLGERLLEYVNLLTYFVEKENILAYDEGKGTGGLSIMGWSAGNCYTIPLLGSVNTALPENKTKILEKYIRSFILFDLPYHCIGEPMPTCDVLYSPLTDPSLKYPESFTKLVNWNASYYTHSPKITSCFSSTSVSTEANLDSFPTREKILEEGLLGQVFDLIPSCTIDRIPQEIMGSIVQSSGKESERNPSDPPPMIFLLSPNMYRSFSDRAFPTTTTRVSGSTDADEDNGNRPLNLVWPKIKVEVLVCERTMPHCIHANLELKRRILEAEGDGSRDPCESRDVRFWLLEGYNHYPHWENPEFFTKFIAGII
ncbi:hypothetical protein C8Q75DRAFT_735003 [Abortiporus biennis]|nr:hypothetical protein C8Q75DRAFT_735003 [Abortiporus biennis]